MSYIFSLHASIQIKQRCINEEEVINCIKHPDSSEKQEEIKTAKKIRQNGQLLMVFYTLKNNFILIITVISTSKLKKYLS